MAGCLDWLGEDSVERFSVGTLSCAAGEDNASSDNRGKGWIEGGRVVQSV